MTYASAVGVAAARSLPPSMRDGSLQSRGSASEPVLDEFTFEERLGCRIHFGPTPRMDCTPEVHDDCSVSLPLVLLRT